MNDDPCPNDTNGDGNCGRATCARCHPEYQPLCDVTDTESATETCTCPDVNVTNIDDLARGVHAFVKGWSGDCPTHGYEGTRPTYRKEAGGVAI